MKKEKRDIKEEEKDIFSFVSNCVKLRWVTKTWQKKFRMGKVTHSKMQVDTIKIDLTTCEFSLISP